MSDEPIKEPTTGDEQPSRRGFVTTVLMLASLVASYGLGLVYFLRFLVPPIRWRRRELFVTTVDRVPSDRALVWVGPDGQEALIYNLNGEIVAFSNVCPHLGCHVHYRPSEQRFVCPCHQGVFDLEGNPIAGPPAEENTPLKRYNIVVRGNAVYLEILEEA